MSHGMSYWFRCELRGPPPTRSIRKKKKAKNIWRWHTRSLKSHIDKTLPLDAVTVERLQSFLNWLASTDQGLCLLTQQIFSWSRVCEKTCGKTKMGCQRTLPKESHQRYWILSFICLAIALHLQLTTLFSIHAPLQAVQASRPRQNWEWLDSQWTRSDAGANKVWSKLC